MFPATRWILSILKTETLYYCLYFFNTLFRNLTTKGGSKGEAVETLPLYVADTYSSPHSLLCAHTDALNKHILFRRQGL